MGEATDGDHILHEECVNLLNNAKLSPDANSKVAQLKSLLELVVNKEPRLLPEFLPGVLEFRIDSPAAVKKYLPDFIDAAVAASPTAPALQACLSCLEQLINDSASVVAKRAIASCYPTYRAAMVFVAIAGSHADSNIEDLKTVWDSAQALKSAVTNAASSSSTNGSARLAAVKFVEQCFMLLTADKLPAVKGLLDVATPHVADNDVLKRASMLRDAEQMQTTLINLLKLEPGKELSGPLAIVCIKAAGTITQQRPQFLGRFMPVLLALGSKVEDPSLKQAVKAVLVAVSRLQHAMAVPWKKKVQGAIAVIDGIDVTSVKDEDEEGSRSPKRQRLDSGAALPPVDPYTGTLQQQQQQQQPIYPPAPGQYLATAPPLSMPMPISHPPPPTWRGPALDPSLAHVLNDAQNVIATRDGPRIASFITSLSPQLLADVVLSSMNNLPPRHALPPIGPGSAYYETWIHQMAASLDQHSNFPNNWPSLFTMKLPVDPRLSTGGVGQQQQQQQQQQQPPKQEDSLLVQPPQPLARPTIKVPKFSTVPVPLVEEGQTKMRLMAVIRMLENHAGGETHTIKRSILARLLTSLPPGDGVATEALESLLKDFESSDGFEIIMNWLFALFVGHAELMPDTNNHSEQPRPFSAYEEVLMHILTRLKETLPPQDKTLARILLEVPMLPMPAVQQYITELCHVGGQEWASLALIAARDIILQRPNDRDKLLDVVLQAAVSENANLRSIAVRLTANRLFMEPYLQTAVKEFAMKALQGVTNSQLMQDTLASMGAATVVKSEENDKNQEQHDGEDAKENEQNGDGLISSQRDKAAALCALYCALCTKQHSLLRAVFETYGQSEAAGKAAIEQNVLGLAKTIGPAAPLVHTIITAPPPGSLDLVIQFLHVYSDLPKLPQALVGACLQLFEGCKDPRVLAPVVGSIDRSTTLHLLPALLELPQEAFKAAVERLVKSRFFPKTNEDGSTSTVIGADGVLQQPIMVEFPAPFAPAEILTALHTLSGDANVLKRAMIAVTVCLSSPDLFPPEALAATINKLLTRVPLPPLFMRTVIQSLAAAPQLKPFVVGVLEQLASKQIWKDATQWKGWVMCAKQTTPESFPLLLQLPAAVLQEVLNVLSKDGIKEKLAAFANQQGVGVVPHTTLQLLSS